MCSGEAIVIDKLVRGEPIEVEGTGCLILQPDQVGPPPGPGTVKFLATYDPSNDPSNNIEVQLRPVDAAGEDILDWAPGTSVTETMPRYDLDGSAQLGCSTDPLHIETINVDYRTGKWLHCMAPDRAHELSWGPGVGAKKRHARILIPNLSAQASVSNSNFDAQLGPLISDDDLQDPFNAGRIIPGSLLELEHLGEDTDLQEIVRAFGWFLSFFAGKPVHPLCWEMSTSDGPFYRVSTTFSAARLPVQQSRTCLMRSTLEEFLNLSWQTWKTLSEEERLTIQGGVNAYHEILTCPYPTQQIALTAVYLERFRQRLLGDSEFLPAPESISKNKKSNVESDLRKALRSAVESSSRLEEEQKRTLLCSLRHNPNQIQALFRKSFRDSLVEVCEHLDIVIDQRTLSRWVQQRDEVTHGAWDSSRRGTLDTYWISRYGISLLEKFIMKSLGYKGKYFDRSSDCEDQLA